ncbi:MAG: PH domain-containing protein [Acidimicrobiales bacterium]
MPYPAKLLHEGEDVYLDTRPHWWVMALPSIETVVVLAAEGAGFVLWSSAPVWFGWVLLGVGLVVLARFFARLVAWRSTDLVITSMRVIYRKGVFHRQGVEIPLSSVQSVQYSQSLFERVLRKGNLEVESAGSHGAEMFVDIPKPAAAQSLINRAIDEAHTRVSAQTSGEARGSVADEIERLAQLHQRGIITDEEFSRMKRELIAGDRSQS